jgi:hypothetical protein
VELLVGAVVIVWVVRWRNGLGLARDLWAWGLVSAKAMDLAKRRMMAVLLGMRQELGWRKESAFEKA